MEWNDAIESYYQGILSRLSQLNEDKITTLKQGMAMTNRGPAPFTGDILDHPELLWTEDEWNEERLLDAKKRIEQQGSGLGEFWKGKYQAQAHKHWHEFYKRNKTNFYKDRHYLHIVFPELAPDFVGISGEASSMKLLEVGCGVGNAVLPLLEIHPRLDVTAVDFARAAIDILSKHEYASQGRLHPSVCDVINDPLPVEDGSMDAILCMFVLSAIAPEHHRSVISKLCRALRPGGYLLLRDYGRFDEAQLRFGKGAKLEENFYVRQDGTCAYYFDKEDLKEIIETCHLSPISSRIAPTDLADGGLTPSEILTGAPSSFLGGKDLGMTEVESSYVTRQYANRQQQQARYRVWVHARFQKKLS